VTREQMDRVLQVTTESEAAVLLMAAAPSRTAEEKLIKAAQIEEEIMRCGTLVRDIISGDA